MINSGQYLDSIIQHLTVLRQEITSKADLGFTDLNKHCEDFVKEIFNITYDLKLVNLNEKSANFPGLDLGDEKNKIAFQITSTKTGDKVDHTLEQCIDKKHYNTYKSINVFILTSKQTSYSLKTITTPHFTFDVNDNIKDFDDLYKDILLLGVDKRKQLDDYIQKELPYYWNLIKALDNDATDEAQQERQKANVKPTIPKPEPLIDTTVSLGRSNMSAFVLWAMVLEISSFPRLSTPNLLSALQRNQLIRNGQIAPTILNQIYRRTVEPNRIHYIHPLHSTGPVNHLIEQQLLLKGNSIIYEFAEYHNQDLSMVNLNHPLSSLIFLLLTLQKYHDENGTVPDIKVSLQIDSTKPALIHSDASPFDFGFILENYKIHDNHFKLEENLVGFDNESIYNFMQNVYHAFICTSPSAPNPYLRINRADFDTQLHEIRQEFKM